MRTVKRLSGYVVRRWLLAVAYLMGLGGFMVGEAVAQSTGTNTVTLVSDNMTNASNVLTPLVIGISIIFLVWRFIRKVATKAG